MLRGYRKLVALQQETDRSVKTVLVDGVEVRRILLRTCAKYYRAGLEIFLLGQLFERLERVLEHNADDLAHVFDESAAAEFSEEWLDVAGQLMPQRRFETLCDAIETGQIDSLELLDDQLGRITDAHDDDVWTWVRWAYGQAFDQPLAELSIDDLQAASQSYLKVRGQFLRLVVADAEKEFAETARVGFGVTPADADTDFTAIRGSCGENEFVCQLKRVLASLEQRVERVIATLNGLRPQ
jgi:hypothetical protein